MKNILLEDTSISLPIMLEMPKIIRQVETILRLPAAGKQIHDNLLKLHVSWSRACTIRDLNHYGRNA